MFDRWPYQYVFSRDELEMRRGWRLKDTGPTIAALILSRVVGAAMIVVSVVLIVRMIIRG